MADTNLPSLKKGTYTIFNEAARVTAIDTITQGLNILNAAGNGALTTMNRPFAGDKLQTGFYDNVVNTGNSGLYDVKTQSAVLDRTGLTQDSYDIVKFYFHAGPYAHNEVAESWNQQQAAAAGVKVGQDIANRWLQVQVESLIAACVAVSTKSGNGTLVDQSGEMENGSAATPPSDDGFMRAAGLLFDRQGTVRTWLMHPNAFNRYARDRQKDFKDAFSYPTAVPGLNAVNSISGDRILLSKSAKLAPLKTVQTNKQLQTYLTLGFSGTAATLYSQGGITFRNNIDIRVRPVINEYVGYAVSAVGARGYSYTADVSTASPNEANLANSANWTRKAAAVEDTGVVCLQSSWPSAAKLTP